MIKLIDLIGKAMVQNYDTENHTGPCTTRQMTPAERKQYGLPPKKSGNVIDPDFAERLRKARKERHISQQKLGECIGATVNVIKNAEHGKWLTPENKARLCDFFGWEDDV